MSDFITQLIANLYHWTSLQFGDYNLADIAVNAQDSFLQSSFAQALEIIAAIVTITLTFSAWILNSKRKAFEEKTASHPAATAEVAPVTPLQEQWNDILRHVDSIHEGEWKFAVIEADTIVDSVLQKYFPGDTMGERLMNIDKTKLLAIDGVWEAHKIRNRLSHDVNYFLRHAEAVRGVRLFESALRELGAIA